MRPLYDCRRLCERAPEQGHSGDPKVRAAMRCSLPDFDPLAWDPSAEPEAAAEAEQLASHLVGQAAETGVHIDFELDRDGCPMGYRLSRFGLSVEEHVGRRSIDDERRQPSLAMEWLLRRAPERPDRVLEAVAVVEAHEDACYRLFNRLRKS